MKAVVFHRQGLNDFEYWKRTDKKIFRKIQELIQDIDRNHFQGLGKPEPLKYQLAGFWSRRINSKHRLVYQISEYNEIIVASCRHHYT